jgi:DNA-binding winged helix-turn-helix (wHTH) protein
MMDDQTYRFLDYELNVASQRLAHRGADVAIRPKTLATLCYLIKNRHRLVTKDDLLDSIWAGADVQEQAVFQSISELRSTFAGKSCIETVRGRGYRWIVPLKSPQSSQETRWSWRKAVLAASLPAIAAVVALGLFARESPSVAVVINPITSSSDETGGDEIAPSVTQMLLRQMRQMGWETHRGDGGPLPANAFEVDIDLEAADAGLVLRWAMSDGDVEDSGLVDSYTPLGAVRDLAAELHKSLQLRVGDDATTLAIADMVDQARHYIETEDYDLAESYLDVVLAEKPGHLSARMALAYTHQQTQQHQQALDAGLAVHQAALRTGSDAERMVSAILLSQVLSEMSRYTESERFAREALELGSSINDLLAIAEAQEQLGEISLANGDVGIGRERLAVALQYYSTFCPSGEARVNQRLTEIESLLTDKPAPVLKSSSAEPG